MGKPAVGTASFVPTTGWFGKMTNAYNSYDPIRIDLGKPYEIAMVLCYFIETSAPFQVTLYDSSNRQLTQRSMTSKPPFIDPFEHFDFRTFETYKTRSEILSYYQNHTPHTFLLTLRNIASQTDAAIFAKQLCFTLATYTNLMEDIRDPLLANKTGWTSSGIHTIN